jgi:hypothetical protein
MKPERPKTGNKNGNDYSEKWVGKECAVVFTDGSTVIGKVLETRKYFIELMSPDGRIIHINKAHIKMVIPDKGEK